MIEVILAVILWTGPSALVGAASQDTALQDRVMALARQMRCLVCQNQTLADSQADLAVDLRNEIAKMVQQGKTDRQIMNFFVERYGDFVLYRPPIKPATYFLWFAPFLAFVSGGILLFRHIRGASREQV